MTAEFILGFCFGSAFTFAAIVFRIWLDYYTSTKQLNALKQREKTK